MSRYVAFLRAINVGGRRISNVALCARFEELGFSDVSSFRASGNVIFAAASEPPTEMAPRLEAGLSAALGYEVPVFLRTANEVRALATHEPFAQRLLTLSRGKLQVVMLSARPAAQVRKEVLALASDENRLAFGDRELHWLPSGGIADSAFDLSVIAKLLGPMTVRTKGTVEQIAAKYFAD